MKSILAILLTLAGSVANAQSVNGNLIRLYPSTLPTVCNIGDIATDTATNALKFCNPANTWGNIVGGVASVPNGGTGVSSLTPYAPITGGTTSTGAVQQISMAASTGLSLVSNGTSALPTWQTLGVAGGGTGLTSGTSGGVLYFSSGSAISSSAALASNQLVLGGGSGVAPTTLGSLGTSTTVLHGNASGAPSFGSVQLSSGQDISGTLPIVNGGTGQTAAQAALDALSPCSTAGCLIQYASGHNSALNTSSGDVGKPLVGGGGLSSAQWAVLGVAGGGTGVATLSPAHGVVIGQTTSAVTVTQPGTAGQVLTSNGASSDPTYQSVVGGGSKNYLAAVATSHGANTGNGNFELASTTGWSLAHSSLTSNFPSTTATAGTSFSSAGGAHGGSAANGNLSLTVQNFSTIAGTNSGLYNQASTATTAGDLMISDPFFIDFGDAAHAFTIKFSYQVAAGAANTNFSGTSSNSFGVAIYDVTNGAWIMPAGVWNLTQSSGTGYYTGTFQTTSNSTQYQLAVFNANATGGTVSFLVDDFSVGPAASLTGPAMTDWTSFTPTGSWSTNTTYTGWWKREGDKLSMTVKIALAGAPTSAALTVNLPSGLSIDTTKLPATPANQVFNSSVFGTGAGHGFVGNVFYGSSATNIGLNYILDGSTASIQSTSSITQAAPYTFANADFIYFSVTGIPIVGWSSNTAMSSDTDTRVVAMRAVKSGNQTGVNTNNTSVKIQTNSVAYDTHGAYDPTTNYRYTVPVTGYYQIDGFVHVGSANVLASTYYLEIFKNGSDVANVNNDTAVVSTGFTRQGSATLLLNAGDYIELFLFGTGNNSASTLTIDDSALNIKRISGPAVISATETVAFAAYKGSNQTGFNPNNTAVTVTIDTVDNDTHGGFNTGSNTYVVPVSGRYVFQAGVIVGATNVLANQYRIDIVKNGSRSYSGNIFTPTVGTSFAPQVSTPPIKCAAGDSIILQLYGAGNNSASTLTLTGGSGLTWFGGYRVGN